MHLDDLVVVASVATVISLNPKNTGSTYIKSDANTLWARNAARRAKEPASATEV
jgi:hypothetical protein